jgi:hypothetical protein
MPSPRAVRRHRHVGDRGRVIHHGLVSDDGEGAIGWIREIVLDSSDPLGLARFWAGLLGGEPVEWYPGWITLEPPPHGQRLSFQGTGAGDAPAADGGAGPLLHFDVLTGDLAAAHERVIAAGAVFAGEHISSRPGPEGEPVRWRVYRDPAGHPFCLVTR